MSSRFDRPVAGRILACLTLAALAIPLALPVGGTADDRAAEVSAKRVKPKSGPYKGRTSQGKRVSFKVKGGRVQRPRFFVRRRKCGAQYTFTGADKVSKKGKFSFGRRSSSYFKGKFVSRRKVRGRAGIDFSAVNCGGRGVHSVRYGAHRKG